MKKLMILTLAVAITINFSSCSPKPDDTVETVGEVQKPVQTEEQKKPEENDIKGLLELAYLGKIDRIQVGVGARLAGVIEELGEPMELGHFEGSSYVSYQNVTFMLDKIIENTVDEATVMGIIASDGYELYGVRVGMTMEEIKKVLGAAQQEYKEGKDEADMWKLEYECGQYKIVFFFDGKTSPSTSAYLSSL